MDNKKAAKDINEKQGIGLLCSMGMRILKILYTFAVNSVIITEGFGNPLVSTRNLLRLLNRVKCPLAVLHVKSLKLSLIIE